MQIAVADPLVRAQQHDQGQRGQHQPDRNVHRPAVSETALAG